MAVICGGQKNNDTILGFLVMSMNKRYSIPQSLILINKRIIYPESLF